MTDPTPDTDDLRAGEPIHDALLALLPVVGRWRGEGSGVSTVTGAGFRYGQQLSFAHDGRAFLAYESRAWLVDESGATIRQAWRESGFWRPSPAQTADGIEAVMSSTTGLALVFQGVAGDQRWELETTSVVPAGAARDDVDGERRLYALVGEQLAYATELAVGGRGYAAHLNARLNRL